MSTNEKKGVTIKIDADLHAEVKRYIEEHGMTMGDFVALALQDELHPKLNIQEDRNMGNMRTLAFQVPEELFQKIKDYLQRNNMTQKQFVIGLIENEIERDLRQRADMGEAPTDSERVTKERAEQQETAAVGDCESVSEEVGEQSEEQESTDFSDDFDSDSDETEDLDDEMDETEDQGMSLGMQMNNKQS
ncbi:MAG: hypothetical protein K2O14_09395, partial [Oscillospiraceae bacterium]|nr:hypothetical protein [Oscillospiraceae bacterium]